MMPNFLYCWPQAGMGLAGVGDLAQALGKGSDADTLKRYVS